MFNKVLVPISNLDTSKNFASITRESIWGERTKFSQLLIVVRGILICLDKSFDDALTLIVPDSRKEQYLEYIKWADINIKMIKKFEYDLKVVEE